MNPHVCILDVEQRSDAWKALRCGRLTGSVAGEMTARLKDGKPGAGRQQLLLRLALERLTGRPLENGFISDAMQAGIDREPEARAAYEALTGTIVHQTGFLAHQTLMAGASLDGHVGDFARLVSIKCRQPKAHYEFLRTGTVHADALAQLRHELWLTDAPEADYFCWSPDFPEGLQSRCVTVYAADVDLPGYDAEARAFLASVDVEIETMRRLRHQEGAWTTTA